MQTKFCTDCIFWEKVMNTPGKTFGICNNTAAQMDVMADGKTILEQGTLWTAEYFGCVHWRNKQTIVIKDFKLKKDDQSK